MTNQQIDRTISSLFEYATRSDGTRYVRLAEIPDSMVWLTDAVHAAHDDEMPNDWRYETCWHIVAALEDGAERDEIADSLVDVYTADLVQWLADDISRIQYDAEAIDVFGHAETLADAIRVAQYCAIEAMVHLLADAIDENRS